MSAPFARFGGLHLQKSFKSGGLKTVTHHLMFDVWRLEDTWAIKRNGMDPTIASFVHTPFLNIDSIAVNFVKDQRRPTIYENGFFQAVRTRTLEINCEPNPFPLICVVRSLILAAQADFWIGSRLAEFTTT